MAKDNEDYYLTGKLLLAMPGISDPRFNKAVILVCSHDEKGAMGLVINHTLPGVSFEELVDQLKIKSDITLDASNFSLPIMSGGPVESGRGFILHSTDFKRSETMTIADLYGITGTIEALRDVLMGNKPKDMLFILGYAGWTAGQLDAELQQNSWLVVDPDPSIIFHSVVEDKWKLAIGKLGINPSIFSGMAGSA